jgi:hypothetical protein
VALVSRIKSLALSESVAADESEHLLLAFKRRQELLRT